MTENEGSGRQGLRHFPTPPRDFDPFAATDVDMKRHGLPVRPDPGAKPGLAAQWEALFDRAAARYRDFEHLELRPDTTTPAKTRQRTPAPAPPLDLLPQYSCGYEFDSPDDPFISLFVTWTVPDIAFNPLPNPNPDSAHNHFHTFVGLGYVDVHVEMTVNAAQNVTSQLVAEVPGIGPINMQVRPGDVLSASLCMEAPTAYLFLANETTQQTVNFSAYTPFPPAAFINAGVTRGDYDEPPEPLASFGAVYFDDISAATTNGNPLLTSGDAVTMVDQNGATLASPVLLNANAFKCVCEA
jgi:hypothetical protein